MKLYLIIIFLLCFNLSHAQEKLILEPHILLQYDKGYLISKTDGDNSFKSPVPSLSLYIGAFVEYYYKKNKSILLSFDGTAGQLSFRTTLNGATCKIVHTHQIEMNLSQISVGFSQYLRNKNILRRLLPNSTISLFPKFSFGFGLSKNKPQSEYDQYFNKTYVSGCSVDTFKYSYTTKVDSKFNLSLWIGYGIKILHKKKEVLSLGIYYNKGLMNQFKTELNYKLNNNAYSAIIGSRSSNINIKIGVPITLRRWEPSKL